MGLLQRHTHWKLEKTRIMHYNPGLWEAEESDVAQQSHICGVTTSPLRVFNEGRLSE